MLVGDWEWCRRGSRRLMFFSKGRRHCPPNFTSDSDILATPYNRAQKQTDKQDSMSVIPIWTWLYLDKLVHAGRQTLINSISTRLSIAYHSTHNIDISPIVLCPRRPILC